MSEVSTKNMFQMETFPYTDDDIINGALPSAIRQNVSTTLNDVLQSIQSEYVTGEKLPTKKPEAPAAEAHK